MSDEESDPSGMLSAASFRIACWDPQDIVCAAALATVRQAPHLRLLQAKYQLTQLESPIASDLDDPQSLYLWACYENRAVEQVCQGIAHVSEKDRKALRVCYLSPELASRASIFVESGAQMVAAELPFLSSSLLSMARRSRVFRDGNHPLTTGLLKRLPWQSIADEKPNSA
ncbi:MAG: hypothetical protein Aurels2KO_13620 [Aureliella sp.]